MSDSLYGPPFWHACWANGGGAFNTAGRTRALDTHWPALGVAAGGRVLVPLCGKSPDMAWLAAQGFDVVGVEISPVACAAFFAGRGVAAARTVSGQFVRWEGGGVTIMQGDFFEIDGTYAAALDCGALVALPGAERGRYARHLRSRLAQDGAMLLLTIEYDAARRSGPPFPVFPDEVRQLFPGAVERARRPLLRPRWTAVGGAAAVAWMVPGGPWQPLQSREASG